MMRINKVSCFAAAVLAGTFATDAFAAPTIGSCSPTKVKFLASDVAFFQTSSTSFVNVPQSTVNFIQGGAAPSCVIVSVSANSFSTATSPGLKSPLTVRAVLDGSPGLPNEVDFSDGADTGNQARAFDFIFPTVAPGAHTVRLQFKVGADNLSGDLNRHNIVVQFAP